jgi:hypothetical protein
LGDGLGKNLDRHLAIEGRVHRLPHHAHPTLADFFDKPVVQKSLVRTDWQLATPSRIGRFYGN